MVLITPLNRYLLPFIKINVQMQYFIPFEYLADTSVV